jgi:hypothetical protein
MHVGPSRKRVTSVLLWAAPLAWLGCGGGGGTDIVLPSLTITTSTAGVELDSDGYAVAVDGGSPRAIGPNATVTVDGLPDGQHTVELSGMAANCSVANNPRTVRVSAGTATAAFAISCGPSAGSIAVTTTTGGTGSDPDGFALTVDGLDRGAIGVNASVSLAGVAPGIRSIGLTGLAANCVVAGDNPRSVTVTSGQATPVGFAVTCAPASAGGSVQITAATSGNLVDPDGYTIQVDQGSPQTLTINGSQTVGSLTAGPHSVLLGGVAANCTVTGANPRAVTVAAGQTATVTFVIACVATAPSVNFRISNLYITQSTQTLPGSVPLVAGRSAYLRVFVVGNQSTGTKPSVNVTFRNGASVTTRTISAPGGAMPTSVQEGMLASSWNLPVEAALLQPGLSVLAEVDPQKAIAETNENDNTFPASGTPQTLTVNTVPVARIRFVPIQQGSAPAGNVSAGNKDRLVEMARRIYPLNVVETDVRAAYTTSTVLTDNPDAWLQVLSEIDVARLSDPDGAGRTYFGVARLTYQFGLVGLGYVGVPSAMGTDNSADVVRVVAHELGHTWNQLHAPCGDPPPSTLDPSFPYSTGTIGKYGFDVVTGSLKFPSSPDIMGYCFNPWISDYTYSRVMTYRQAHPLGSQVVSASRQPTMLIWGRIVNGRPVLEPAFQVVTRPVLPAAPGAYSVEGVATDGTSLFSLSFDAVAVADDPRGGRHFAFAVPLDQARAARLADVRLVGPGGTTSAASLSIARLRTGAAPDSIVARRTAGGVALEWNASSHPMIMVRDPDTGEVLSFARGGKAQVWTRKGSLDLVTSDGVRSKANRVSVTQ